jgi:hypothetical protein
MMWAALLIGFGFGLLLSAGLMMILLFRPLNKQ